MNADREIRTWPPKRSSAAEDVTTSSLWSTPHPVSMSASMGYVSSDKGPVTRQYDRRQQLSGSASPRLHTPRTPMTTPRPAGPRTTRTLRCEASFTAMVAFGEVSGQLELSELLTELRRAPMASEIPPRWRQFEASKHTSNRSASQKHLVAMEGRPSQLRFPGASAGPPEQAVFLAHAICHAKREAHAESAQGFELSGAARGMGPGAPQRQSMAQAEVMVGSREEERWWPIWSELTRQLVGAGQVERAAIVHFLRGENARIFRQQRAVALASLRESEALAGLTALPDEEAVVRAVAADRATAAALAGEREARRQSAAWRDKFEALQHEACPPPGEIPPHPYPPPLAAAAVQRRLPTVTLRPPHLSSVPCLPGERAAQPAGMAAAD